jgi:hypothetical protein
MAIRNAVVVGVPTVLPSHGGGTSFYIGNNKHARGVWNTADGLLSGEVLREQQELAGKLGVTAPAGVEQAQAIGRALYRKAFAEIADDPRRWSALQARKVWLLAGNDELTQDYDPIGERELLAISPRFGVPFGVLIALTVFGVWGGRQRARRDPQWARQTAPLVWGWLGLACATAIANVVFFTSSQHRLPLAWLAAIAAGVGVDAGSELGWREVLRRHRWLVAVASAVALQAFVPRSRQVEPTAVHYFNLSVAYLEAEQPHRALQALDRAVVVRADHPVILLERASLRRRMGVFAGAREDLTRLQQLGPHPSWIEERIDRERGFLWGPVQPAKLGE